MKKLFFISFITMSAAGFAFVPLLKTLYDFKVADIDGKEFDMKQLKGKKVLIVNVASECGYTPQYKELQKLYTTYKDSNFILLGFPSNDFGQQEPGTAAEIKAFCEKNYGVTFPLMSKITVSGKEIHPLYKWLTAKNENGISDEQVKWNFNKFMICEEGTFAGYLHSKIKPMDKVITDWIMDR